MRFIKCSKCEQLVIRHDEKPRNDETCSGCYRPQNPTFGWMMSEYHRRGLPLEDITRLSTRSQIENFLYRVLDIKKPRKGKKDDSEQEIRR